MNASELMAAAARPAVLRRVILPTVVLSCTPLAPLPAQVTGEDLAQALQPGQRVRVAFRCAAPVQEADPYLFCPEAVGVLQARTIDSLVLDLDDDEGRFAIPLPTIGRLQVSEHRHTRLVRGAALGLGAGAVAGLVFGWGATGGDPDKLSLPAVLAGAGIGLIGGAFIGVRVHADEWRDIPLGRSGLVVEVPLILRF